MPTHTFTHSWASGAESLSATSSVTDNTAIVVDQTILAGQVNKEIDVAFAFAKLSGVFVFSDQTVTLKTNSSGSPAQTIAVAANVPIVWNTGAGACPFTADVTKFFVTNAGATDASLKVRLLENTVI